jgi:AcrR family transcriptional regulator
MTAPTGSRRGRPRSDVAEGAIIGAALDLLAEGVGPSEITIAEVARRAAVGKDTVYRRWRSKDDLLVSALRSLYGSPDSHREGPIREVLIARLAELIERMHDPRNQRVYESVLTGCGAHPLLRERFYAEVIDPRREATFQVIRSAIDRGELRADADPGLLGMLLFSPILAETFEGRPRPPLRGAPRAVAARLVDAALTGALPPPDRGPV